MRTVRDIQVLRDIPVLVRAALNEPVENGEVKDTFRLTRALPTLRFLADHGARVVVISHIDPPSGTKATGTETLEPVARALARMTTGVSFFGEAVGERARAAVRAQVPGSILVLENLRRYAGETTNDLSFAKELAALADVFVQDSFDTCHRSHASIVSVPKLLPAYAGLELQAEISALTAARTPAHPALAVVGGAKFHTKEPVITTLLARYDHVFVGGALANDFLKVAGHEVGKSLVSDADAEKVRALLDNPKLMLPTDARVIAEEKKDAPGAANASRIASVDDVHPDETILDQGPDSNAALAALAHGASSILWNGPLGNYENGFTGGTDALARAIAESRARSVVGGGDTVASIVHLSLMPHFSFVSTGGGAMLDFLAEGTLPGIEAIMNQESA